MSPIVLDTLKKILDGSFTVEQQLLTLTINNVTSEYSFTVKPKDPAINDQESPLNYL